MSGKDEKPGAFEGPAVRSGSSGNDENDVGGPLMLVVDEVHKFRLAPLLSLTSGGGGWVAGHVIASSADLSSVLLGR